MKMIVQKAYLKKVILLLLLLTGSTDLSFSVVSAATLEQEQNVSFSADYSEQLEDIHDGSLPGVVSLNYYKTGQFPALLAYQLLSVEETKKSAAYIRFSRHIEPALGAEEIIYPFHFFL